VSCKAIDRDLDAYVDRELRADAATTVRQHLASCGACRARVAERHGLSRLVQAAPYYSAPDRLRARITAQAARTRLTSRLLTWSAVAALVVVVGGGFMLRTPTTFDDSVVEAVVDSHVRSLMADHLFDVQSTDRHAVKPWFLGKLDFAPPVVDLASGGFPLVGGRLDYLGGRPVAAIVYQRQQHTINLFVCPATDPHPEAVDSRTSRGFHVHHWSRDGMRYWAVSDLNEAELTQFVSALKGS
jgi:anti-sigma factor RsiW